MFAELAATASDLDELAINVSAGMRLGTKTLIAVFLFGVALDVRVAELRDALRRPAALVVGLSAQFIVLPGLTVLLVAALDVRLSVALGLLLVSCCPAGNLSNLLTYRARGDIALSVALTTLSNSGAIVATPVDLAAWGSLSPQVSSVLVELSLSPTDMFAEVGVLVILPFLCGALFAHRFPATPQRARRVVEPAVLVLLLLLVSGGLASNASTAFDYVTAIGLVVVLQNLLALLLGYGAALGCRLPKASRHAMTLELGVRNTALGLVLALTFFPHSGRGCGDGRTMGVVGCDNQYRHLIMVASWCGRQRRFRAGTTLK